MNSQSSNQHAAAEFVRLMRERRGVLDAADKQYIVDLYMRSTNMDRSRVEQWLTYTLERMPSGSLETRTAPIMDPPIIELPTFNAPNPNEVVAALASRLPGASGRAVPPPPPMPPRPEDLVPPKL